jgi:Sulfatase
MSVLSFVPAIGSRLGRWFSSRLGRGAVVCAGVAWGLAFFSRIALLVQGRADVAWDGSLLGAFLTGAGYDLIVGLYAAVAWLIFGCLMPGPASPRGQWWVGRGIAFLFSITLLFNAVAEWFFWDEFQVRFNFIAVDYLVWTQEVWGNINESYPMPIIFTGLALGAAGLVWALGRWGAFRWIEQAPARWPRALGEATMWLGWVALTLFVRQAKIPAFANQYNRELAKNGLYSFGAAFWEMEINYDRFYRTLPGDEAMQRARALLQTPHAALASDQPRDLHRVIKREGEEKRLNVILVCMESQSADFMARFKNKKGITPNLDRLCDESLFFSRCYATGTRTVRGMEALTLSLPPTPGQAILYRPNSTGLETLGTQFASRGYDCAFLYGGDGGFDYMNRYFGGNGYRVVDKPTWKAGDISYETSWGACDEDLYRKSMAEADAAYAAGKPFHQFCMTTSNHRPFQFPSGKIPLASDTGRNAACMYADYALGWFLAEVQKKPWFESTLIVMVADHCASSAGKNELDVRRFHIPAYVWNPQLVKPQEIKSVVSQIDIMPTVLGLLNWSYRTKFFGHDVLAPGAPHRAFVSNYQKIGLIEKDELIILKPRKEVSRYGVTLKTGELDPLPLTDPPAPTVDDAVGYYQSAAWLFKSGGLVKSGAQ